MKYKIIVILATLLILTSCQSSQFLRYRGSKYYPVIAKVFNGQLKACEGVEVTLIDEDGKTQVAYTDVTGKALFSKVKLGSYIVEMKKEDYEFVRFTFELQRPDQSLYGRLYSFDTLINECQTLMDEHKWDEALTYIDRAEQIGSDDDITTFLKAVIFWKTNKILEASIILEQLYEHDVLMPEPMLLFLADIYQYDLENFDLAKEKLEILYNQNSNEDIRQRLLSLNEGE